MALTSFDEERVYAYILSCSVSEYQQYQEAGTEDEFLDDELVI